MLVFVSLDHELESLGLVSQCLRQPLVGVHGRSSLDKLRLHALVRLHQVVCTLLGHALVAVLLQFDELFLHGLMLESEVFVLLEGVLELLLELDFFLIGVEDLFLVQGQFLIRHFLSQLSLLEFQL